MKTLLPRLTRYRQSRNDLRRQVRSLEARITAAQHVAASGWTVDDEHLGYLKMAPVEEILDALNPTPTPDRQDTP